MATLRDYLKNLQKDYPPIPPTPTPTEDVEQKAEAFDYLTGRDNDE